MTITSKLGLTLAALVAVGLAAVHPAAAQTVVFSLPTTPYTGPNTGNGGGNGLALGNEFKDSAVETITSLGFFDNGSASNTGYYSGLTSVNIFDETKGGTTIASVTVNGTATGGTQIGDYYFVPATGVLATPGDTYLVGTYQSAYEQVNNPIPNSAATINDTNVSYVASGAPGGGAAQYGFGGPNPRNTPGDNSYFDGATFTVAAPNIASPSPEPSQIAGLGFAVFGVLGLILKARKRTQAEASA